MISKTCTLFVIAIVVIVTFACGTAQKDTELKDQHLVWKVTKDAYTVGETEFPALADTSNCWVIGENMRINVGDSSFIYLADKRLLLGIDHKAKTYYEMAFGAMGKMLEQQVGTDNPQKLEQLKAMFRVKATVTSTDETKNIGDWSCRRYMQEVGLAGSVVNSEIWACKELQSVPSLLVIGANPMTCLLPGFDEMLKEFSKIEGVAVLTVTSANFNGVAAKISTELLSFEEKTAPTGTLAIPEGYQKTEMIPGSDGG